MPMMVIYGDVDGDGSFTVNAGSDGSFASLRVDEGTYSIDFTPDFAEVPVVMVTFRDMGITEQKEDVALVRPAAGQCLVFTRSSTTAKRQDADFSFMALGPAVEPGAVVADPVVEPAAVAKAVPETPGDIVHNEPPD
jgi:hypothetical protein